MAADLTISQMYDVNTLAGTGAQQEVALPSCGTLRMAAETAATKYAWTDGDIAGGDYMLIPASGHVEIPIPSGVTTVYVLNTGGNTLFDCWLDK